MNYQVLSDGMSFRGLFATVRQAFDACPSFHESEVMLGNYPVGSFDEYDGETLYLESERRPALRGEVEALLTEHAPADTVLRDGKVVVIFRHCSGDAEQDETYSFEPAEYAWLEYIGLL